MELTMRACDTLEIDRSLSSCRRAPRTLEVQHLCDWLESQAWMMDAWIGDAIERSSDPDVIAALCQHREWLHARIDEFRSQRRHPAARNNA
jgi:hypothetical protein